MQLIKTSSTSIEFFTVVNSENLQDVMRAIRRIACTYKVQKHQNIGELRFDIYGTSEFLGENTNGDVEKITCEVVNFSKYNIDDDEIE